MTRFVIPTGYLYRLKNVINQWYYKTVAAAMEKRSQESVGPLNNLAKRLTQTVNEVYIN
jgi:hypothetical protein